MKACVRVDSLRAGFTIVETMIVLAVTGGLFVAIAATISGRQNSAEFTHAIQSVQSQVQQAINQVGEGFYPSNGNFTCQKNGSGINITGGSSSQGTNSDCVFLGKVIQFGIHNTNPEQYVVYTIAGLRGATGGTTPFRNASPTVVATNGNPTQYADIGTLQYGLSAAWMKFNGIDIGAVGFLMEPGTLDATSGTGFASGTQQVDMVPVITLFSPTLAIGDTPTQGVAAIDAALQAPLLVVNPSASVQICLASGSTNQSGLLSIGGAGRQLSVALDIKPNRTCT